MKHNEGRKTKKKKKKKDQTKSNEGNEIRQANDNHDNQMIKDEHDYRVYLFNFECPPNEHKS